MIRMNIKNHNFYFAQWYFLPVLMTCIGTTWREMVISLLNLVLTLINQWFFHRITLYKIRHVVSRSRKGVKPSLRSSSYRRHDTCTVVTTCAWSCTGLKNLSIASKTIILVINYIDYIVDHWIWSIWRLTRPKNFLPVVQDWVY